MKIYLHWWIDVNAGQMPTYIQQLKKILLEVQPKQVLHIPFARTWVCKRNRRKGENRLPELLPDVPMQYLDGRFVEDIELVEIENVFVIISGWNDNHNLYRSITNNHELEHIVRSAPYILWDSAGMMVLGKYFRWYGQYDQDNHPGLWCVDMVGIPHFTERGRTNHPEFYLKNFDIQHVIGLDELTILEIDDWVIGQTWWEWSSYIYDTSHFSS